MEGTAALIVIGAASSFVVGRYAANMTIAVWRRRANLIGEELSLRSLLLWRLRNGFRWCSSAADILLGNERVAALADEYVLALSSRGLSASAETFLSCVLAISSMAALLSAAMFGNPVCLVVAPLCIVLIAGSYAASLKDKRCELMRESLPQAFDSMATCFNAGYTLLQTFRQVSNDVPGPVGTLFLSAAHVLEAGGSSGEALEVLKRGEADEVSFVAVALDVQHQAGGSMGQVLDAAADSVKGELALKRSLRVQTAQAKLSARVV